MPYGKQSKQLGLVACTIPNWGNLYTFTASDFTGYTPDTYDNGVIAWQYPGVTTFVGGIQITF